MYAILSSLSGVPIKQSFAVTGSVNQKGEIQPIGGVNQKIEGFFRVCQAKGLTGQQAVLIPYQNVTNLMLREEVVEAVKKGQFAIYSARTIDEDIEILTGTPAGQKQNDGTYLEGTVNYLVDKRLRRWRNSSGASTGKKSRRKRTRNKNKPTFPTVLEQAQGAEEYTAPFPLRNHRGCGRASWGKTLDSRSGPFW